MLLVLHQGAIGDFLLAMSVVQPLARILGTERVEVIASAASARVAAGRSVAARHLHPDSAGLHTLFAEKGHLAEPLAESLAGARFVLSFLGGPEMIPHRRLVTATRGSVVSIDPRPTPSTLAARRHITRQWADDIARQGGPTVEPEAPVIHVETLARGAPEPPHAEAQDTVVIHPGSGGRAKCWPLRHFLALADRLAPRRICWMLGPTEMEDPAGLAGQLRARCDRYNEPLIAETDLEAAARKLAACKPALYVGNDAGTTHLAAALGLKTLAIFTATEPAVWQPLGKHVTAVLPRASDPEVPAREALRLLGTAV